MYIVIIVSTSCKKEAERIAQAVVEHKLAPCANIIDNCESIFWWRKKIEKTEETILLLKSKKSNFNNIVRLVKSLHSYEVPEIIALPIVDGNADYLRWIDESVRRSH
ncbi:MAG: divalent-cation tolerance protein CutA [Candidatus Omnitrophica bacterium]|nr:divalent-cation tolerance protein CutA [Candidatus Omnitrophota bacterium]